MAESDSAIPELPVAKAVEPATHEASVVATTALLDTTATSTVVPARTSNVSAGIKESDDEDDYINPLSSAVIQVLVSGAYPP